MESLSYRGLIGALLLLLAGSRELPGAVAGKDLEGVRRRLESEKKRLSQLRVQEGSVLKSLGKITEDLDKKNKELKAAHAKFASIQGAIQKTQAEANLLRGSIAEREGLFRQRAVALYRWQRGGDTSLFLNRADDLAARLRLKRYLEAALSFDRNLIGNLQRESQRQEYLRGQLSEQQNQLEAQRKVLAAARAAVARQVQRKRNLLVSVRREKGIKLGALREMAAAAQRLQKMLAEIARRAIVRPRERVGPGSTGRGLEALLGQLDWPVKGSVSAPFGKFKHPEFAAEIVRKGIDIDAPRGDGVRVVEKGRVVFADRFTGYGRMVIVDHGERYYTIYGHLSEIIKKNGEELGRGEILGRVGDSDSLSGAKLYFELRKDGRSIDPLPWLRKR